MAHYTFTQLEDLWTSVGGNPQAKAMAAAIAMAESGGNSNAVNNNGGQSIDRGLWQINSVHGAQSTFDAMANARAAVSISKNGTNWRPWCTAYSDGLCGSRGGTYLGQNSPFMKFLTGAPNIPSGGGSTGSGGSTVQTGAVAGTAWYNWMIPLPGGGLMPLGGLSNTLESGIAGAVSDVIAPIGRAILHSLFVIGGAALVIIGLVVMTKNSNIITTSQRSEPSPPPQSPNVPSSPVMSTRSRSTQPRKTIERSASTKPDFEPTAKRPGRTESAAKRVATKKVEA